MGPAAFLVYQVLIGLWGYVKSMLSNIGRIQHLEPEYLNPIGLSMPGKKKYRLKKDPKIQDLPSGYVKIAMESGHRNSGFSHEKWWVFP